MDIAEKIAAEIDAIPGQPTSYEIARVVIEAYQREMWTPHFTSRGFNPLPELRRNRASNLTARIMGLIGKYICEHDQERDCHREASGDLFEAIYEAGCDIITDADRRIAGLPDRGPYGMTAEEMRILEARHLKAMLEPMPPVILPAQH